MHVLYKGLPQQRGKQGRPSLGQSSSSSLTSGSSGTSAILSSPASTSVSNNQMLTQSLPQLSPESLTVSQTPPPSSPREPSPIATSNASVTPEPDTSSQLPFSTGVYQICIHTHELVSHLQDGL